MEIPAEMLARFDKSFRDIVLECAEYFAGREVYRLGNDADIFMNHSDQPNLLDLGDTMVAARDIAAGEELTCDYRKVHVAAYRPAEGGVRPLMSRSNPYVADGLLGLRSPDAPTSTAFFDPT